MHTWATGTDASVPPRVPSDDTVDTVPEKQEAVHDIMMNILDLPS